MKEDNKNKINRRDFFKLAGAGTVSYTHLEVAQVGDDGNLGPFRNLGTKLIVDISKDGLPGRTHLLIVERTFCLLYTSRCV